MKKGVIFAFLFLLLGVSVFVSAFSFSDLFNPTGKVAWEITEPTGVCMGGGGLSNQLISYVQLFSPACVGYSSSAACDAQPTCAWESTFIEIMDNPISVNQGWNLLSAFYYPSQISSGDVSPNNVKAIYALNPITKNYIEFFPLFNETAWNSYLSADYNGGQHSGYSYMLWGNKLTLTWVYFDKAGSFKMRTSPAYSSEVTISQGYNSEINFGDVPMFNGWNFLGILPKMFYDINGVKQNSFTLNSLVGNCDVTKAYFYGGTDPSDVSTIGQWTEVGLNEPIPNSAYFKSLAISVTDDCFLGRVDSTGKTCSDTDGLINTAVKGTVTIRNNLGNVLETKTDNCGQDFTIPDEKTGERVYSGNNYLSENYCSFRNSGVTIQSTNLGVSPTGVFCKSCVGDGACV